MLLGILLLAIASSCIATPETALGASPEWIDGNASQSPRPLPQIRNRRDTRPDTLPRRCLPSANVSCQMAAACNLPAGCPAAAHAGVNRLSPNHRLVTPAHNLKISHSCRPLVMSYLISYLMSLIHDMIHSISRSTSLLLHRRAPDTYPHVPHRFPANLPAAAMTAL